MDWIGSKKTIMELVKKNWYVFALLLLGILLMLLPGGAEQTEPVQAEENLQESTLQEDLTNLLAQISGVGKVAVLLTESAGAEPMYQQDTQSNTGGEHVSEDRETVLVSGSDRTQVGLVRKTLSPVYLGAVVVCQGGDNPAVRLSVVAAVKSATGLSADRISVLKMK